MSILITPFFRTKLCPGRVVVSRYHILGGDLQPRYQFFSIVGRRLKFVSHPSVTSEIQCSGMETFSQTFLGAKLSLFGQILCQYGSVVFENNLWRLCMSLYISPSHMVRNGASGGKLFAL